MNCQHVIQEIEFVSIDTHVSARGRIYLLQSQQRARLMIHRHWRTSIRTYVRGCEHKGLDHVSERRRRMEREVLFDRESH